MSDRDAPLRRVLPAALIADIPMPPVSPPRQPSHDEIARRDAAILLRSFLPRPNKFGHDTVYRRRILGEKDFRLIQQWLERFQGSAT